MHSSSRYTTAHQRPAFATFPPLASEVRDVVSTEQAAFYLGRTPQTLRFWSCSGSGLLQPIRVGARLGWPVAGIRKLLGVPAQDSGATA